MSSGQGDYKIRLDVIGNNVSELLQTQKGMAKVREEANGLAQALKAGFGIDIAGRINSGLAQMPRILGNAVDRGYEFNKRMFDAGIGISNVLAKFLQLDAAASKREAAKAMEQIIELEPKTAGTLDNLVEGFLATVAASQAAGISVKENIDLVGRFANAVANANLPTNQLAQEMRAILTGNITADAALAKVLSITNPDITKQKQQGTLYEFLIGKIGQLGEAGDSAAVRISTLQSAIDKVLGKITEPIFERVFGGTKELTDAVNDPELLASLNSIGLQIAELVDAGVDLTKWALENADALMLLAQAGATLAAAFAVIKIRDLLVGLGSSAHAWLASRLAVEAETVALIKNNAVMQANAALRSELALRPRNFATAATLGQSLTGGVATGGLIVLTLAASIIKQIEASTLARLDAEEKISQEIADREKKRNDEIRNLRSLEAAAKQRAALQAELTAIDDEVASRRTKLKPLDPVGSSSQYQVRTLTQSGANLENDREINKLLTERERIARDLALLNNPGRIGGIISGNLDNDATTALLAKQEKAYAAATARADELEEKVKSLRREQALLATDAQGQVGILRGEVVAINAELAKQVADAEALPDAAKRAAVIKDLELQAETKRIPLLATIAELIKKISEDTKKTAEEAEKDAKAARDKAMALQDSMASLKLAGTQNARTQIEQNPFLTGSQKRDALAPVLAQENQVLQENIRLQRERIAGGTLSAEELIDSERRLLELQTQSTGVQFQELTNSFGGQFQVEMTNWLDSFGTNAQQVAGILTSTIGAGIDSVSQNLAAAILQTQSWGDAWDNIKLQVVQTFLTMVIRYAATRAAMFAISKAFGISEVAVGAVQAAATAAVWAPAATAASIATFGAAAGIGTASYIAGLAAGQTATLGFSVAGAFAEGGIFKGKGTGTSDSNLIAVSNGEGIVRAAAVDHYGADFFNAFNNMELGAGDLPVSGGVRAPAVQGGGSSTTSMPNVTVINIPDEREATRIGLHSQARGDIVRIVREERDTIWGNG